jgi:hypothetical protein
MPLDIDPLTGAPIVKPEGSNPATTSGTTPSDFVAPSDFVEPPSTPPVVDTPLVTDDVTTSHVSHAGVPPLTLVPPVPPVPASTILDDIAAADAKPSKEELLANMRQALEEHGMLESNIPHNHAYWGWKNQYRG